MPFIYSSTKDTRGTDQRPPRVEQLFSPCYKPPRTAINDRTYQIPVSQPPVTPTLGTFDDNDFTLGFSGLNNVTEKFPRQSTCLKGDKPPPLLDPCQSPEPTVATSVILDTSNRYNDNLAIPEFKSIYSYKDDHPVRATCFHPRGKVYVVGTNSKVLQICKYPTEEELKNFDINDEPKEPRYAFKFLQIHRGSVYCAAFNKSGSLLATGSNDQTVHLINYNSTKNVPQGDEYKLTMHNGTVRDLCFLNNDLENESTNLLVSAGAGDNSIQLTDYNVKKPVYALRGHQSTVMSLHSWNETPTFVSGSLDGTIRFWDTRGGKRCTSIVTTNKQGGDMKGNVNSGANGKPVGVVRVEQNGKLLVSGHQDGRCMLYDIRGGKVIQLFQAHDNEIRTLNLSPNSYYLLTGSYDRKVKLMDLQGDLSLKLPCVDVALLNDKVIQTAWHPKDFTFVTTSADGSASLWAMPELGTESIDCS